MGCAFSFEVILCWTGWGTYRGTSLIRKRPPLEDPAVGLCLGPYDGPRGVAFSYERGTHVGAVRFLSR
jgi:hypothetical protein